MQLEVSTWEAAGYLGMSEKTLRVVYDRRIRFPVHTRPILLKVEADDGTVVSHQAVSIGLIVTELVMNALKHAFPNDKKDAAILVSYKVSDTDWKLTVSDNGIGKRDLSASEKKGGLGTSLVKSLAKQLDAQVNTASDARGTAVSITHATFKSKPLEAA